MASDPSWFTVLFAGEDADAALAYVWRCTYTGTPLGQVNLFDRAGLNLIAATLDEAAKLVMEPGVAVIVFCDIDKLLIRSGTANAICESIARARRVVVPVYFNLDESERRFTEKPFEALSTTVQSEALKITKAICSAVELSWQLQQADAGSTCRKQFIDLLGTCIR